MINVCKSDIRKWLEEINRRLVISINGTTPEGFEPVAQWDYDYNSARIPKILYDTNEAGLYPCFIYVVYNATRREMTYDGFDISKWTGVVEVPISQDKSLIMSGVDFFDGFLVDYH